MVNVKSFICHYTGKDGQTPRRRNETLRFFDLIPKLNNTRDSPTPLWYELIESFKGKDYDWIVLHAQLSKTVAVYVEVSLPRFVINFINDENNPMPDASVDAVTELSRYLDYTTFLQEHPKKINPPILNAYRESRPEFSFLNKLYKEYNPE